jgi:hypothetical protein
LWSVLTVLVPVLLPVALWVWPCIVVLPVASVVACSPIDWVVPLAMLVSSVVVSVVVLAQAPSIRQKTERAIRGVFFI